MYTYKFGKVKQKKKFTKTSWAFKAFEDAPTKKMLGTSLRERVAGLQFIKGIDALSEMSMTISSSNRALRKGGHRRISTHTVNIKNQTGVVGVYLQRINGKPKNYVATFRSDGIRHTASFSIKKYGAETAYLYATHFRLNHMIISPEFFDPLVVGSVRVK